MDYNIIPKQVIWIFAMSCGVFILFAGMYYGGVLDQKNFSSALNFLSQTGHTGLSGSPAQQIAFEQKTSQTLAQNTKPGLSPSQAPQEGPTVLFDISAEPFFQQASPLLTLFWLGFAAVILGLAAYYIYRFFRLRKLQKIKGLN